MSVAVAEAQPWSRRRWFWTIAAILAAQAVVMFLLSRSLPHFDWSRQVIPRQVRLVSQHSIETKYAEVLALNDPTLFVLSHRNGFSGAAWTKAALVPYRPKSEIEPPHTLAMDLGGFGIEFARHLVAPSLPEVAIAERNVPPSPLMGAASEAAGIGVRLRIHGDLAKRRVLFQPPLAFPETSRQLSNCVVYVVVNATGETISAVVWPPLDAEPVERTAVEFAKRARFAPEQSMEPGATTTGEMVFQWVTQPQENRPAAGPSP